MRRFLTGILLALIAITGFAATFVFGSSLTQHDGISYEVLSLMRFIVAGGIMAAVMAVTAEGRRKLLAPTKRDWQMMLVLGPIGTTIMAWFVFAGCARVSIANASMADALTPLMIFLATTFRLKRIGLRAWLGLGCGLFGALLVVRILTCEGWQLSAYSLGDVYILLAAATWAVYTAFGRDLIRRLGSAVFTIWTMAIGCVVLLPFLFFTDAVWPTTFPVWCKVLGLGIISTLMPFWAWNAAQKYLPVTLLAISAYLTPVIAMGLGCLILGEHVTGLQWLGVAFVFASALVETGRPKPK